MASISPNSGSPLILSAPVPAMFRLAAIPESAPPPGESSGMLLLERHTLPATREVLARSVRSLHTPEGVREHSTVVLDFDPAHEELTLHHLLVLRDGVVRDSVAADAFRPIGSEGQPEGAVGNGNLTLATHLDDVRPGDIIDLAFTTRNLAPVFEGKCFFGFTLGWPCPVAEAVVTVTLPADSPTNLCLTGLGSEPRREKTSDGGERLVWHLRNPKPLPRDGALPSWHIPAPHVQGSDFADWNEVALHTHRLWEPSLRRASASAAFQEAVADLKRTHDTSEAFVQAAIHFAQDQIRSLAPAEGMLSYVPADPERVLARRFGDGKDKSLVLCALLRAGGVTAWPTLVNSALQHTIAGFLPSPGAFNHVIVCLRIEKRYSWVDPTIPAQGGTLETRVLPRFVQGLIVHPQSKGLVKLPKPAPDSGELLVHDDYAIDYGSKAALLSTTTTARGTEADSLRQRLQRGGREGVEHDSLRALQASLPGAERASGLEIADDREANRLVTRESFHVPGIVATHRNSRQQSVRLPGRVIAGKLADTSEARRDDPLHLPFPNRILQIITATVPAGMEIAGTRNTLEGPGFTFSTSMRLQNGGLEIRNAYTATANRVEPGDFALFTSKLHRVREILEAAIPLPLAALERKSRTLLGVGAGAALVGILGLVISSLMKDGRSKPAAFDPMDDVPSTLSTLESEPVDDGEAFDKLLDQGIRDALADPGTVDIGGPSLLEAREFDFSLDPGAKEEGREFNKADGLPSLID